MQELVLDTDTLPIALTSKIRASKIIDPADAVKKLRGVLAGKGMTVEGFLSRKRASEALEQ